MDGKVLPLNGLKNQQIKKERVAVTLHRISLFLLAVGALLFVFNVNDFSHQNTGLMIAIGFLVASMQTFIISMITQLIQIPDTK